MKFMYLNIFKIAIKCTILNQILKLFQSSLKKINIKKNNKKINRNLNSPIMYYEKYFTAITFSIWMPKNGCVKNNVLYNKEKSIWTFWNQLINQHHHFQDEVSYRINCMSCSQFQMNIFFVPNKRWNITISFSKFSNRKHYQRFPVVIVLHELSMFLGISTNSSVETWILHVVISHFIIDLLWMCP